MNSESDNIICRCDVCNLTTKYKSRLTKHQRSCHDGIKHKCNWNTSGIPTTMLRRCIGIKMFVILLLFWVSLLYSEDTPIMSRAVLISVAPSVHHQHMFWASTHQQCRIWTKLGMNRNLFVHGFSKRHPLYYSGYWLTCKCCWVSRILLSSLF